MSDPDVDRLFARTLAGGYDDDEPWEAVRSLRNNANRSIFERASEWCHSTDPLKRARGCDILSQLRTPTLPAHELDVHASTPIFVSESFQIILQLLKHESDETALKSQIYALGHLRQDGAIALVNPYAADPRPDIRQAATHTLGQFPNDPSAIEHLIKLADDADEDIRNWALFALGSQSDADTPALRELFVRHLDDSFEEAREEAIAGLAKRQDKRAVLPLFRLMKSGSYYSHHHHDFLNLVTDDSDASDWGTEDFIDALYVRFPDILPPRDQSSNS